MGMKKHVQFVQLHEKKKMRPVLLEGGKKKVPS